MLYFHIFFSICVLGDAGLYYVKNNLPKLLFNRNKPYTPIDVVWDNLLSYIILYFIYANNVGYMYHGIGYYNTYYTIISPSLFIGGQYILLNNENKLFSKILPRIIKSNLIQCSLIAPAIIIPIHFELWFACYIFMSVLVEKKYN
jgi:hypothetical protein